ncbi:hypothetical protein BDV12DRAFT_107630 [Aspergillus spectabilis]
MHCCRLLGVIALTRLFSGLDGWRGWLADSRRVRMHACMLDRLCKLTKQSGLSSPLVLAELPDWELVDLVALINQWFMYGLQKSAGPLEIFFWDLTHSLNPACVSRKIVTYERKYRLRERVLRKKCPSVEKEISFVESRPASDFA